MESMILRGVSASGIYNAKPQRAIYIKEVNFNLPTSGTLQSTTVTISGALTGSYAFSNTVNHLELRFKPNEDVYVTTTNFLANYGAIINYIEVGDDSSYMQTDRSRTAVQGYSTPWRFR